MDKTAIRNFAIEARKILMKSAVTEAGFYGITKEGCAAPVQKGNDFEVYQTLAGTENRIYGDDIKRRANLVKAIQEQGFDQVIEETAYTWFNRIIAIRFMEVNNYLPTRVRVLSSETGSGTPDIITQADTVELNLTVNELDRIQTAKRENKYDEAFRLLFVKQCNELNEILPGLFEKTNDYMELLLKITYTGDGVVRMLVDSIPEDNFNVETEGQVEIIGWMYQYYNTELKDDTFAKLKKNVKITKERIPAATQLFTPDWIVRYMVENALGRVWIEHLRAVDPSVDEKAKAEEFGWKYYLPEAEQEADVASQLVEIRKNYRELTPQDITCIDPCMGSGHILVYMFDVLMDIYRSEGFSEREAVFDILEKNIRGLDIDRRAYQLSYFALMMKARGYNRIFFRGRENLDGERVQAVPQVYAIEESNSVNRNQLQYFGDGLSEIEKNDAENQINGLLDQLADAKEFGSILNIDTFNWTLLSKFVSKYNIPGQMDLNMIGIDETSNKLKHLVFQASILSWKYDSVVTNPPYMGSKGMNVTLSNYLQKHYPTTKYDMFAAFIERCLEFGSDISFIAMITQNSWMSGARYEAAREKLLRNNIMNMAHLGTRAFDEIGGEVVQTVSFCFGKGYTIKRLGQYLRLVDGTGEKEKEAAFWDLDNRYLRNVETFNLLPSKIIGYWVSDRVIDIFKSEKPIEEGIFFRQGMATSDNDRFLRHWPEVDIHRIGFAISDREEAQRSGLKWFPYNKGGSYRKWYGNNDFIVNWENDGQEMKDFTSTLPQGTDVRLKSKEYYFKEGFTWSALANSVSVRWCPKGFIFDTKGSMGFPYDEKLLKYFTGLINSKISEVFLKVLAPTLDFNLVSMKQIPMIVEHVDEVSALVDECIELSKIDWDSTELSWDYKGHPLTKYKVGLISEAIEMWKEDRKNRFNKLKENEERINRIFADIYGLDEIDCSVSDEDVTLQKVDIKNDIKDLLSYAVGCILGRYSLDKDGIAYAGGLWDSTVYKNFLPDIDNILPITDEQYFEDDIVVRICAWLGCIYGEQNVEQNMQFIADVLSKKKGENPKNVIREYFLTDFIRDHIDKYNISGSGKKPIYWLFDSGKQNGFKCLVYLHRYNKDTVGLIRSDYLTKTQNAIENALNNANYVIQTSSSAVDKAKATKDRDKYIKQLSEIKVYYQALSHIALQRIELDLDTGVKLNYQKFQGIEVSTEGEKKQTIDLLAKL